jgi:hypothetical protein
MEGTLKFANYIWGRIFETLIMQELLYRWTEHSANFSFLDSNWGRENGPPNSTPGVDFLDHDLL